MIDSRVQYSSTRDSVSSTIVFVDTDAGLQTSIKGALHRGGMSLHAFGNAADALQFIRTQPVDIIITAMRLPEMSGIELLNHASALHPYAIRIITSGLEDKPVLLHVLGKGLAHDYVVKPWASASLPGIVQKALILQHELLEKNLQEIVHSSDALPSPPMFHQRLRTLLGRETSSLQKIATEIEKDGALVAQLLRVANSVYYGARSSISNIRDAVVFIGTEYIASLIMALEAFRNVGRTDNEQAARMIDQLWHQALRRATIARLIGKSWVGFQDGDLAYVSSLLQDIGYVMRISYEPDNYATFLTYCNTKGVAPHNAESTFFKIPHDDLGATLLRFWNLPSEIVNAVARHHHAANDDPLTQILQIADVLELSDASIPHDITLDPIIRDWAERLQFTCPQSLVIPESEYPRQPKSGVLSAK